MIKLFINEKSNHVRQCFYSGMGYALTPFYARLGDNSGYYLHSFKLFYYGKCLTIYFADKNNTSEDYGIHKIAEEINTQLFGAAL